MGVIFSPMPSTNALRPWRKKGTSAPSSRPRGRSLESGQCSPHRRLRASKVLAASEDPPPMPACEGMRFSTLMVAPLATWALRWSSRAARTIKSSRGKASDKSMRSICSCSLNSKCSTSAQSMSMKTDWSKWYPSARLALMCKNKLSLAGAKTSLSSFMVWPASRGGCAGDFKINHR